jgi:pyruvate dehydrogenase E1 component
MNENYPHPDMKDGREEGIIKGAYLFDQVGMDAKLQVNLMGSGTIFREVIAASQLLLQDFGIGSNIFSATSFNLLRRFGMEAARYNLLHPSSNPKVPYITELLGEVEVTVAATDYIRNFADQIREYVPGTYITLGTDGFGRSDYRVNLRTFFEVNRYYIALAALFGLYKNNKVDLKTVEDAIKKYNIDTEKSAPWML